MLPPSRNLGGGQVFCAADTFDAILRSLSPDYFAALHGSIQSVFGELGIKPQLEVGWMHPGYACPAPGVEIPSIDEPGGVFGWVTQAEETCLYRYGQDEELAQLIAACGQQRPRIQWASCSLRLFRFDGVSPTDFDTIHDVFVEFALGEQTDWAAPWLIPEGTVPHEPWRELVFAAATDDAQLAEQAWRAASEIYTPSAMRILRGGMANTRKCNNW